MNSFPNDGESLVGCESVEVDVGCCVPERRRKETGRSARRVDDSFVSLSLRGSQTELESKDGYSLMLLQQLSLRCIQTQSPRRITQLPGSLSVVGSDGSSLVRSRSGLEVTGRCSEDLKQGKGKERKRQRRKRSKGVSFVLVPRRLSPRLHRPLFLDRGPTHLVPQPPL